MKHNRPLVIFAYLMLPLVLISCTDSKQEIDIHNSAFISGNEIQETVEITMKGKYDKKDHIFTGSLFIGDKARFEYISFSSGSGLISYHKETRTILGQIFFDDKSQELTMDITDHELIQKLTPSVNDEEKQITLTSPATNREEAQQIHAKLKAARLPFED